MDITGTTATNKKISELYQNIKNKNLILQPEFQRKLVWNDKHRQTFIETILKGLPFPEIYIADRGVNLETTSSEDVVVDGQQRLSTIVQYIDGELKIAPSGAIKSYQELSTGEKRNFLSYKVVVRQIGNIEQEIIKEIFKRINLTRYPLNAYEIHHALYEGEFIRTASEILKESKIMNLPTFSEADSSRMHDLGLILLIMATIEHGGFFTGDKEIEKYIKKFNDQYHNKKIVKKNVLESIKRVKSLNLPYDSTWFRKSNLFTLLIELYSIKPHKELKKRLIEFEKKLVANKNAEKENDYSHYYSYMFTGTNSRQARVERANIFRKYIKAKK